MEKLSSSHFASAAAAELDEKIISNELIDSYGDMTIEEQETTIENAAQNEEIEVEELESKPKSPPVSNQPAPTKLQLPAEPGQPSANSQKSVGKPLPNPAYPQSSPVYTLNPNQKSNINHLSSNNSQMPPKPPINSVDSVGSSSPSLKSFSPGELQKKSARSNVGVPGELKYYQTDNVSYVSAYDHNWGNNFQQSGISVSAPIIGRRSHEINGPIGHRQNLGVRESQSVLGDPNTYQETSVASSAYYDSRLNSAHQNYHQRNMYLQRDWVRPLPQQHTRSNHYYENTHIRRNSDSASVKSVESGATTSLSFIPHANLESYRQQVKKSKDPNQQLEFGKQLLLVAEEMRKNPNGLEVEKVRRNRDILHTEAIKWIKKAATSKNGDKVGLPEALFFLADCYGNGTLGLAVDHDRAFGYYLQAAKQDHAASFYRVGVCYEVGAGTKRDSNRAFQYFRKAASLGDSAAMFKIGLTLINGTLSQPCNPREGVNFLKKAANYGDETSPVALFELAELYSNVKIDPAYGVVPDLHYAVELYIKSAKLSYVKAQYKLGYLYEHGMYGLSQDAARSIGWYTEAAKQGDPEAELALSGWYLVGAVGLLPKNEVEAYLWARKSADKGLADAEYAVAYYFEHGIGTETNLEEAKRWYRRAASQGNPRAVARLKGAQKQYEIEKLASKDKSECAIM